MGKGREKGRERVEHAKKWVGALPGLGLKILTTDAAVLILAPRNQYVACSRPFLRSPHRLRQRGALAYIKAMIVPPEQNMTTTVCRQLLPGREETLDMAQQETRIPSDSPPAYDAAIESPHCKFRMSLRKYMADLDVV